MSPEHPREPTCIDLTRSELADAVALARAVGWRDVLGDWESLASCARIRGHRDHGGRLRATGALCDLGPVAMVAKMLVHPAWQRQGLGQRLLRDVLALPRARDAVMALIATEVGQPLYARHGFVPVEPLWNCTGVARGGAASAAVALGDRWFEPARALDAQAIGCDRGRPLACFWQRAEARAGVIAGGELAAFGLRLAQGPGWVIGPLIAASTAAASAVLTALVPSEPRPGRMDVPGRQRGFLAQVRALGLDQLSPRQEMTLGGIALPGQRQWRFAALGLAFG